VHEISDLLLDQELPSEHRSGFVAVVGKPNVGKSTLMNAWLGQKIAIVSEKPQTTRNRIRGILTRPDAQVIFMDTPGIHQPIHKLGEYMVEVATRTIPDADVILFTVDGSQMPTEEDRQVAELIQEKGKAPVVIGVNKIDLVPPDELPVRCEAYGNLVDSVALVPFSATRGDNRDQLLETIIAQLPFGPRYYPEDQVTDQMERTIVAELVREQILHHLYQEVPHAVAVLVNEFKERPGKNLIYISATIFVERESQKAIVIGEGGRMLKRIGRSAREEIERMLGTKVYLDLWVKVRKKWRKDEKELRRLGYALPKKARR